MSGDEEEEKETSILMNKKISDNLIPQEPKEIKDKKIEINEINLECKSSSIGELDKFLSNFSEKQEDVKIKLLKSQENNEILKIPTYEKQLNHYQGIIKFFQGLHGFYENSTFAQTNLEDHLQGGFLEATEIKNNQSFFEFIL